MECRRLADVVPAKGIFFVRCWILYAGLSLLSLSCQRYLTTSCLGIE